MLESKPMSGQEQIIQNAIEGDRKSLEGLLRDRTASLRARLSVHPRWSRSFDKEDVLQVTYLEAFLRIGSLDVASQAGFDRWLWRIAENNLRDAIRALEREKRPNASRRMTQGARGESARTLLSRMSEEAETAGGQLSAKEELERMHRAIESLPSSYRDVIKELELDQQPVQQVAERLGKSEGAVHMLRARARARLRELLVDSDVSQ